jgi:hypothetical protein
MGQLQRIPNGEVRVGCIAIMRAELCDSPIAYYRRFWVLVEVVEIVTPDKVRVVPLGGPVSDGSYETLVVCADSESGYPLYRQETNGTSLQPLP